MKNLKMKSARAALDLSQQQLADLVGLKMKSARAALDELFWEEP